MKKKQASRRPSIEVRQKSGLPPADDPAFAPAVIALPNTSELKMKAMLAVAEACKDIAKALNSVNSNINVTINGNLRGGSEHNGLVIGRDSNDIR